MKKSDKSKLILKLKPYEQTILKLICIEWGHGISKCPMYSKLLPHVLGLGTHF